MAGANEIRRRPRITRPGPAIGVACRFHQGYDRPTIALGHGQQRRHPHLRVRVAEDDYRLRTGYVTETADVARRRGIPRGGAAGWELIDVLEKPGDRRCKYWRYLTPSTRRLDRCH